MLAWAEMRMIVGSTSWSSKMKTLKRRDLSILINFLNFSLEIDWRFSKYFLYFFYWQIFTCKVIFHTENSTSPYSRPSLLFWIFEIKKLLEYYAASVVIYPRIWTTWSSSWWTSRDVWIRTGDAKMNAEVQEIRIRDNDFILSRMIIWSNILLMSPTLWLTKQFVKDPVTTIKWCLKKKKTEGFFYYSSFILYRWRAIRHIENVDEKVVRTGRKWRILQMNEMLGKGQAGDKTWVRVAGHPSNTEY